MVARINHGNSIAGVLLYNKLKVDKGQARVLCCNNLPLVPVQGKIDVHTLCTAFEPSLTHPRSRVQEPVFHVSLNPNPHDRLDDLQLQQIAAYYMEKMGYGDQPYVVYEHHDIERRHLHIVASRVTPDGHAVNYDQYKRRSKALTEQIESLFGLVPTRQGQSQTPFEQLRRVQYRDSDLKAQLSSVLHNLTNRYRFASRGELCTLLRCFNVWMEECRGEVAGRPYAGVIYGALDERGEKVGKPIPASRLDRKFGYRALHQRYDDTERWIRDNRQKLEPTRTAIRQAMRTCRTAGQFAQAMRSAGLTVIFHRSREHGERLYGVTFLDHRNGLVVNGSRLDKAFAANRFEELFSGVAQHAMPTWENSPQAEPQAATPRYDVMESETWLPYSENDYPAAHHGLGILGVLLEEAAREHWEPWTPVPRRKGRKRRCK